MRTELLPVAGLAVDVAVWTIASYDGVQSLVAVVALEALAMPLSAFSKDFLSSEYNSAATRTSFSRWSFDACSVDYRCLRRSIAVEVIKLMNDVWV